MCAHMSVYMHVHTPVCMFVQVPCACMYVPVCTCAHAHVCMSKCPVFTHVHACLCACVHACSGICVCTGALCLYAHVLAVRVHIPFHVCSSSSMSMQASMHMYPCSCMCRHVYVSSSRVFMCLLCMFMLLYTCMFKVPYEHVHVPLCIYIQITV